MIVVLLNVYLVILFCLVKFGLVRFNLFWKLSPVLVFLLLLVGLFIPMGWGAPQGSALVVRNCVAIVPDVSGEVIDVPVTGNTPLKAGDVLFKIDPVLFKTKVDSLQAQLDLAQLRLAETTRLSKTGAGRAFDVEQSQAEVEQLSAELVGAKWDLDKPRPMAMSLISRCEKALALQASHCLPSWRLSTRPTRSSALRFRKSTPDMSSLANPSRSRSSLLRRRVYTGKVESILQAVATGQTKTSGAAVMPEAIQSVPFVARINLDDAEFAASLPAGSAGTAAIFTIMSKRRMSYEKCSYGRWP